MLTVPAGPIKIHRVRGYSNHNINEPGYQLYNLNVMSSTHPGNCSVVYTLSDEFGETLDGDNVAEAKRWSADYFQYATNKTYQFSVFLQASLQGTGV
jgi:hypothetical protein